MRDRDWDAIAHIICWVCVAFIALVFVLGFAIGAQAQDGHAQGHEIYKNWKSRDGQSCCNDGDGRPTRAYVDDEGHWRAWDGTEWVIIPERAMLPPDFHGDGRSHYCGRRGGLGVGTAHPYCFSPGEIRG